MNVINDDKHWYVTLLLGFFKKVMLYFQLLKSPVNTYMYF